MPKLRWSLPLFLTSALPAAFLWPGCSNRSPHPRGDAPAQAGADGADASAGGATTDPETPAATEGGAETESEAGAGGAAPASGGAPDAGGTTPLGGAAAGGRGGTGGAAGGEQACTQLATAPSAATVKHASGATVSPVPSGGAILAGTYVLQTVTYYGDAGASCPDTQVSAALKISPSSTGRGTWERVLRSGDVEVRERKGYNATGGTVTLALQCAVPLATAKNVVEYRYSASPTQLATYEDMPACGSMLGMTYALVGAKAPAPSSCKKDNLMSACADDSGCAASTYVVNGDGTVTSSCCGLQWQQEVKTANATWDDATAYCTSLDLAGGGWRVPTFEELYSLVVAGGDPMIDTTAFPGTAGDYYWTSSPFNGGATLACTVNFQLGITGAWPKDSNYEVRCVR